ncbi:Membrane protein involved in the export of O-antigen and teichoic acid [Halorientalis persicus]|uniref:Membrane protein involved in the export of O-antigen and teichoic acid n=2 Tax=Halorientalis persicus TaxID=1367881 RepID=A0A1H8WTZ5_9EURY|nr:Membrane protein involved in the export of O-antigen and teichoic acid [Halorientalis persicus]
MFVARAFKAAFGFLAVIIFSRKLGASPLGTYYPFLALLGIVGLPADLGIGEATNKRLSEGTKKSSYLGAALVLKTPIVLIVGILVLIFEQYVNQFLGADLALLFVVTLFVKMAGGFSMAVLRGELRVGETAILEVIRPLSWLVVGYLFYLKGYGVRGLIYGYLFGSLLMAIIGWWKVSIPIGRPTIKHAKSILEYAQFSAVSSIGGFFYSWIDVAVMTMFVVVGTGVTRGDVGAYENAWRLALVVMLVGKSIAITLFPQLSRWDAEDATDRIESAIPSALLPSLLLVIPAFVGTLILSEDLLRVLYGPEFTVAWLALIVLAAGKIPQSLHILLSQALNGIDRPDLAAVAAVISAILNLVFNVVLIWQFGLVGAAIATTLAFAVNTLLHAYFLNKFVDIHLPVREAGWSIVASGVMGVCVYTLHSLVAIESIYSLLGVVLVGGVVYGAVVLMYEPIRSEAQRVLRPLVNTATS